MTNGEKRSILVKLSGAVVEPSGQQRKVEKVLDKAADICYDSRAAYESKRSARKSD